jgi:hypothetical protein
MNLRKITWLGVLASLAIAPLAWGQAPAIPPVGGAAVPPIGPVASTAAPTAAPSNLWSFLLPTDAQKTACKTCFCNSALGQMVSSAAAPMAAMSGGLMANRCMQNSIANDIANNPADSSQGAAARIKKDEEDAKARRNAVRYLGTVDCSRWPEAEAALAISLRYDRNECVRFEAALALRNGCCCTNTIIDALSNCVLGENKKDKFPIEKSDRVRAAAADALARCPLIEKAIDIEKEKNEKKVDVRPILDPKEYYQRVAQLPREQVVAGARAVLVSLQQGGKAQPVGTNANAATVSAAPVPAIHQRPAGLAGLVANAFAPEPNAANSTSAPGQTRPPFFANLTKSLTGKQEGVVAVRQETIVPAQTAPIPVHEVKTVMPLGAPSAPARQETRPTAPTEIKPSLPRSDTSLGQPRETMGAVEIEDQPAPANDVLPPASLPVLPRR